MNHQEGTFTSKTGTGIYYQYWLPEEKIRGILLIVHGLNEHCGRYHGMAEFFTGHGFAVYGLDFPGHGRSEGVRSYVDSFTDFTDPLATYLKMIQDWQPDTPIFLIGHSMGGLIASIFLLDHQEELQGAVLSASLVKVPDYVSDFTVRIGRLLSKVLPKFRIVPVDIANLSRDPAVVEAYRNDPLVYTGKSTVRISNVINNGINRLAEEGSRIEVPVLLLHGGADKLCDPAWSEYLYELFSSPDKQLKIYDGFYHEVYNEPEKESVLADVLAWVSARLP